MPDARSDLSSALAGRYVLERELGRGGMATVFLAADTRHGRQVAVKVLDAAVGASVGSERFLREIRIAAGLAHPHILPLIDSGDAAGRLYYVTPFVPGGSLADRIGRGGPLPIAEAVRVAREVGAALDFAHRQGFVHRDVKPHNILFADRHAVLADFGIARACCAPGEERVTETGLVLGTPEYMSPEQASGEQDLGGRSDLYSLACVVYEMLSGEPPHRGSSPRETMARQIVAEPRPLRALRPETPSRIERAVAQALAKRPEDRFPTVADFLTALDTDPDPHASVSAAAIRCIAVLPFVNASPDPENEYLSDGITDELIDALAKVAGLRVAPRSSVFALKNRPQDVRAVGALLGASWVLEGTVRRSGDQLRITAQLSSADEGTLLWSERFDRRLEDAFAIQEEIARTIVDTLRATSFAELAAPTPRRYTVNAAAYGLYLRGRHAWNKRTHEAIADAIGYFEQAIFEDPAYAPAYAGLADAYALQIDYRNVPVAEGFARAKEHARRALALDDSLAEAHASLAWSLFIYDWEWDAADHEFRRAIALGAEYAPAHQWYTFLLACLGRHDAALVEAHTALELDPASVSVRRCAAWAYYYARRYDQARYHASRAIAMNPTAEESYRALGFTLVQQGQFAEAIRVLRGAATLPGAGTYARSTLGYALARAGERGEAEALAQGLEEEGERSYVSPAALATLHIGLGNTDRALHWTFRAHAERRGWLVYLGVNPVLDPLRDLPRFRELMAAMRL